MPKNILRSVLHWGHWSHESYLVPPPITVLKECREHPSAPDLSAGGSGGWVVSLQMVYRIGRMVIRMWPCHRTWCWEMVSRMISWPVLQWTSSLNTRSNQFDDPQGAGLETRRRRSCWEATSRWLIVAQRGLRAWCIVTCRDVAIVLSDKIIYPDDTTVCRRPTLAADISSDLACTAQWVRDWILIFNTPKNQ